MSESLLIDNPETAPHEAEAPMQQLFLGVLVIQPSPFCNINCDYCYLPDRTSTRRMSFDVLRNVMREVDASGLAVGPFDILWHAGEPLAVPLKWYEEAFKVIAEFPSLEGKINHTVQSNGLLITDGWCEFIKEHDIKIGLSIDGPEFIHDRHRVTRKGEGTHAKAMQGAAKLKEHDIPFGVVAVISEESLDYPDEIYEFFLGMGIRGVGFNIEEVEGVNATSSLGTGQEDDRVTTFLERVYGRNRDEGFPLKIREFELARERILMSEANEGAGLVEFNLETNPLAMINVDYAGKFSTFSPELLGQTTEKYGTFFFGDLNTETVFEATQSDAFVQVFNDIQEGNRKCSETCEFYSVCDGASPSNKYYENGTFDSAETMHCRHMIKAPIRIVKRDMEGKS